MACPPSHPPHSRTIDAQCAVAHRWDGLSIDARAPRAFTKSKRCVRYSIACSQERSKKDAVTRTLDHDAARRIWGGCGPSDRRAGDYLGVALRPDVVARQPRDAREMAGAPPHT